MVGSAGREGRASSGVTGARPRPAGVGGPGQVAPALAHRGRAIASYDPSTAVLNALVQPLPPIRPDLVVPLPSTRPPPDLDVSLLNGGAATAWANLGDWQDADTYPEAARHLALRLGRAAGLGPGHRVLDVGVGHGEQIRLWTEHFGVASVEGVDRNAEAVRRSRAALVQAGLDARVQVGDGVDLPVAGSSVDRVLALDSAYHLDPRAAFFRTAHHALRPDGRLALTDLVLRSSEDAPPPLLRRLAPFLGVPSGNLITEADYTRSLLEAGFTEPVVEDLSQDVLAGFARWARGAWAGLALRRPLGGWPAVALTGWGAGLAHRRGWVSYVLVTARKGPG